MKMFKVLSMFLTLLCFAAEMPAQVNGRNVTYVAYSGSDNGTFEQTSDNTWKEFKAGSRHAHANFTETNRDEWSVYLRKSDGARLQLDLHTKKISINGSFLFNIKEVNARPYKSTSKKSKKGNDVIAPAAEAEKNLVFIKNKVDSRLLFDSGEPFKGKRGVEGGWTSSPKIVATDANYYGKGQWYLEKNNDGSYFIVNNFTNRYLFCTGEIVKGKAGDEGGWTQTKQLVGSDANYYERAKWNIQKNSDGTYLIINKETKRQLFSTGDKPTKDEGGWIGSPKVVSTDANYYDKAKWNISGPGLKIVD
ncbi:MAG: RICIN domain-containing protein [Saprospiraceae bacterium]